MKSFLLLPVFRFSFPFRSEQKKRGGKRNPSLSFLPLFFSLSRTGDSVGVKQGPDGFFFSSSSSSSSPLPAFSPLSFSSSPFPPSASFSSSCSSSSASGTPNREQSTPVASLDAERSFRIIELTTKPSVDSFSRKLAPL